MNGHICHTGSQTTLYKATWQVSMSVPSPASQQDLEASSGSLEFAPKVEFSES